MICSNSSAIAVAYLHKVKISFCLEIETMHKYLTIIAAQWKEPFPIYEVDLGSILDTAQFPTCVVKRWRVFVTFINIILRYTFFYSLLENTYDEFKNT